MTFIVKKEGRGLGTPQVGIMSCISCYKTSTHGQQQNQLHKCESRRYPLHLPPYIYIYIKKLPEFSKVFQQCSLQKNNVLSLEKRNPKNSHDMLSLTRKRITHTFHHGPSIRTLTSCFQEVRDQFIADMLISQHQYWLLML